MLRKKTITLTVCVLLMVSLPAACQTYGDPRRKIRDRDATVIQGLTDVPTEFPDVLKITRCLYFGDTNENSELKKEFMKEFREKTGINLEVIYPPRTNYMQKVNLMISSGELDGIVNFFSTYNIMEAAENGTIEPLNEYLKDNANWNGMPEQQRNLYAIDGKIYGISAGFEWNSFTRSFRKDWLDRLGLAVPETVEELFEVARAFTEDDPDGNNIDDTIGLTSSRYWNLQDIFQAFGARLNNTGDMSIAWDPDSGVWQDSMLKPEMAAALQYIKELYESGYLDPGFLTNEGSNMRENLWTGKAGSAFYWAMHAYRQAATEMKSTIPEAQWVEVPAIKGTHTERLNSRVLAGLPYVLVKDTKQPKENVNTFVNMLFDSEIHNMLLHGIEGKTFRYDDNRIIIMINPDTGKPYKTPGLIHEMPQFDRFTYPWCYDGTEQEIEESLNYFTIEKEMIEEGLANNLIYTLDEFCYDAPISPEFTVKGSEMKKVFDEETSMAILGEKSIPQALSDYRARMRKLGGDKVLEEANAAIGKEPTQKY